LGFSWQEICVHTPPGTYNNYLRIWWDSPSL